MRWYQAALIVYYQNATVKTFCDDFATITQTNYNFAVLVAGLNLSCRHIKLVLLSHVRYSNENNQNFLFCSFDEANSREGIAIS